MVDRTKRDSEVRSETTRKKTWAPPTLLPDPEPHDGYVFRWVRVSTAGASDALNVSTRLREGWQPVKAVDHPELKIMSDVNPLMEGTIQVGGLMLCKASKEFIDQRKEYYASLSERQMESVDNTFLRENDPRMPLLKPSRKTTTSFGGGG